VRAIEKLTRLCDTLQVQGHGLIVERLWERTPDTYTCYAAADGLQPNRWPARHLERVNRCGYERAPELA